MELPLSVSETEHEQRRGSPDSSPVSRTTTNTDASRARPRNPKPSPSNILPFENCPACPQAGRAHNATVTDTISSACYTTAHDQQAEESYLPLTPLALQLHNLHQPPSFPKILNPIYATQQSDATHSKTLDNLEGGMKEWGTNFLESDPHYENSSCKTQGLQSSSIGSTYHAHGGDIYTLARSYVQAHVTGEDQVVVEYDVWNVASAQELTAWGNDLAGIGEHLGEYEYQEEGTGLDDLVIG